MNKPNHYVILKDLAGLGLESTSQFEVEAVH